MPGKRGKTRNAEPLTQKPGVVYKPSRDRLYVFDQREIVVISGGPIPRAWRKTADRGWCAARPAIPQGLVRLSLPEAEEDPLWHLRDGLYTTNGQHLFPFMEQVRDACYGFRAWVAWLRGLDLASRRAAAPFWDRYWHLLMLAMRCPGAIDLMQSCPALAFALASNWVFRGKTRVWQPLRSARSLVRKRQRVIAGWLGFPRNESTVRILRRVPHGTIAVDALLYLRNALCDENARRMLRHVPVINRDVIRIVSTPDLLSHASPRLVAEAGSAADPQDEWVWRTMRDTIATLRQIEREPAGLLFRSREHLHAVHDEAVELLNRVGGYSPGVVLEIPPPPVEGTEAIVPLASISDFLREGREQRNCVATFAERVALSAAASCGGHPNLYVYRVLWPERATLSITRRGGTWHIDELRCASNGPPKEETVTSVKQWLDGPAKAPTCNDEREVLLDYEAPHHADCDEECLVPF